MDKPMRDYVVTFNVIVHVQAQDEDSAEHLAGLRWWRGGSDVDVECVDVVEGED
jgi:hypothetical protein